MDFNILSLDLSDCLSLNLSATSRILFSPLLGIEEFLYKVCGVGLIDSVDHDVPLSFGGPSKKRDHPSYSVHDQESGGKLYHARVKL